MKPIYSVVIPSYNEAATLKELISRINGIFNKLKKEYEIILIDDGSIDETPFVVKKLNNQMVKDNFRSFRFRTNRGKSLSYKLGFQMAKGDYIITIDADLQDVPEEIPKLISSIKQGYDMVIGLRKSRKDSLIKKFESKIWNFLINLIYIFQI